MSTSTPSRDLHVVLGAGPAGTTLAEELVRRGHEVRLVSRSSGGEALPGVTRVVGDVSTERGALDAVAGAAVVHHAVNVAYHRQVELMPGIQRAVLAAVEREGARLVVLDTLYPYGPTGGAVMTEDSAWNATGAKGLMRAELDRAYLGAHDGGRARVVLARSADFYGPRVLNSSLGGAVFPGALTGRAVLGLGDIDLPHSYTYIGDVAAGLATLGENPRGDGRVWHLPTAGPVTTRDVHRLVEARVERPLDVHVMAEPRPWGPFDEVFMDEYAELFYQHTEPQTMDSTAFEREFGVRPTELGKGLSTTVDWYRGLL
ncbi:NAD-dependent epimerase/dehydratase family protein [Nocardiopsis ganjiahuensis]|uniref:NAD-dependent epimerase/dehydratase family protein n=1 Tax=Nocardiopsis ganjiahuensis TaxID=239984 RepID=UPI00034B44F4|nr:NAD-dependent epimerase/dehydratase family protein [Nocardiopsis ganjiahuensis]